MKKGPLFFLALIVIVAAVFFVFIATFNADRFRPQVVRQLETVLGTHVKLERLSLTWRGGLALEFNRLSVYPDTKKGTSPELSFETGRVVLRLLPLLGQKIQISSIHLNKPVLSIRRTKDGSLLIGGVRMDKSRYPGTAKPPTGSKIVIPFFIDVLDIKDGQLRISDEKSSAPMDVVVQKLDATLKNISPNQKGDVDATMALFGDKKNLSVKGRFRMPGHGELDLIENGSVEVDLDAVDLKELEKELPASNRLGLQDVLGGKLSIRVQQCRLDKNKIVDLSSTMTLTGGRIRFSQLTVPMEDLSFDAGLGLDQLEVKNFSAKLSGGAVKISGEAGSIRSRPLVRFQSSVDNLALENFLPAISAKEPQLHGRVTGTFAGGWSGKSRTEISKTLAGEGQISVKDGVIANLSILRETLGQLTMFRELLSRLENGMGEKFKSRLMMPDTLLKLLDQKFFVQSGRIIFEHIQLNAETMDLTGMAEVGFNGNFKGKADLRMASDMSEVVAGIVPGLKGLLDTEGRLAIPLSLEGSLPRIKIKPDLEYVTAHVPAHIDWEEKVTNKTK